MTHDSMAYLLTTLPRKGVGHRAPAAQLHPEESSLTGWAGLLLSCL